MKINWSYALALIATVLIFIWFLFNSSSSKKSIIQSVPSISQASTPTVLVARSSSAKHDVNYEVYGRTEANRIVTLKSETSGLVTRTPAREGQLIKKNQIVCKLQTDARIANLDQAKATLDLRKFDLETTKLLVEKGFKSAIQLKSQEAAVDIAEASVKQSQIELENVNIRNHFEGILSKQIAEAGDYLLPGQACATIIEMNPVIVSVELTEQQIENIRISQKTEILLSSGKIISGKIRYLESISNPLTRTFKAEIEVDNDDSSIRGGLTASVKIKAGTVDAHLIPSKILTLNSFGDISVRYVNPDNTVGIAVVEQIDEDTNGIWVTGLPRETLIILDGQDYVIEGSRVDPKFDNGASI